MNYNANDILTACIDVWKGQQMIYNPQYSPFDTLDKLKDLCEYHNIKDKNILKDVFDECEDPFVYNIENDDITNSEDDEEDDEEDVKCDCCETPLDHFRDGTTTEGHRCNNCYWEDEAQTEDEFDAIIKPDYRLNVRKY